MGTFEVFREKKENFRVAARIMQLFTNKGFVRVPVVHTCCVVFYGYWGWRVSLKHDWLCTGEHYADLYTDITFLVSQLTRLGQQISTEHTDIFPTEPFAIQYDPVAIYPDPVSFLLSFSGKTLLHTLV